MPKKKLPPAVIAAMITASAVLLAALFNLGSGYFSKPTLFGVDLEGVRRAQSIGELNQVITLRWQRVDTFLGMLATHPALSKQEKKQLAELKTRTQLAHGNHAQALQQGNVVLAHERLKELQSSLRDVDDLLQDLKQKHPEIAISSNDEYRDFWREGVIRQVSYEIKNDDVFRRITVWIQGFLFAAPEQP